MPISSPSLRLFSQTILVKSPIIKIYILASPPTLTRLGANTSSYGCIYPEPCDRVIERMLIYFHHCTRRDRFCGGKGAAAEGSARGGSLPRYATAKESAKMRLLSYIQHIF